MVDVSFAFPDNPAVSSVFRNEPSGDGLWHGRTLTVATLAMLIGPCVYFIRTQDDLLKIGYTKNLAQRRQAYGVAWDHLLAVTAGTYDDEQALHKRFAVYCARGVEYYWPTRPIVDHVNEIRERLGVPAVGPW